jgi:hypothetical protein
MGSERSLVIPSRKHNLHWVQNGQSKVKKAEEVVRLAQSKLAEATSEEQELLNGPVQMEMFSQGEAATGEPNDAWFDEQAERAFPR